MPLGRGVDNYTGDGTITGKIYEVTLTFREGNGVAIAGQMTLIATSTNTYALSSLPNSSTDPRTVADVEFIFNNVALTAGAYYYIAAELPTTSSGNFLSKGYSFAGPTAGTVINGVTAYGGINYLVDGTVYGPSNSGITTINIGGAGDTVNIAGSLAYASASSLELSDKLVILNNNGGSASGNASGLAIEENGQLEGYIYVGNSRASWDLIAPASNGTFRLTPDTTQVAEITTAALSANRTYTLPDVSGTLMIGTSGILSLANGGTNKEMSASAGSIVYSDSDSMEMSSVGTAGQPLLSGGVNAPSWFNLTGVVKASGGVLSTEAVDLDYVGSESVLQPSLNVQQSGGIHRSPDQDPIYRRGASFRVPASGSLSKISWELRWYQSYVGTGQFRLKVMDSNLNVLAYSNYLSASVLTTSYQYIDFIFAGTLQLAVDTLYRIEFDYDGTGYQIEMARNGSSYYSPGHWWADASTGTIGESLDGYATNLVVYGISGEIAGILPLTNGGTNASLTANHGAIVYSDADSLELLAPGTAGQPLLSSGAGSAPAWFADSGVVKATSGVLSTSAVDLASAEVTDVLPLAKGGTNKNMTAVAGAVVYSDADSLELTSVGTAGQVLKPVGSTPTFADLDKLYVTLTNNTGSAIAAGSVVCLSQSSSGDIVLADASALSTSEATVGVVESEIANGSSGRVQVAGRCSPVRVASYSLGGRVYLSETAGSSTQTPPSEESEGTVIFVLGTAVSTTEIILNMRLEALN
jgi:hypothetical protein